MPLKNETDKVNPPPFQIRNMKRKQKESDEDPLIKLLNYNLSNPGKVRNLEWAPQFRFVYCPKWLLQNVVSACTGPCTKAIFFIDTTYNIGNFFVTPTTYQLENVKHDEYGVRDVAHFPGPAMFHARQLEIDFHYFANSLCELIPNFNRVKFVCGDRSSAQQGFLKPLVGTTFLPCARHVQQDCERKLVDLKLDKEQYIKDIFGDHKEKVLGLIDSSKSEFECRAEELQLKWDPCFSNYFRTFVLESIKRHAKRNLWVPRSRSSLQQCIRIHKFKIQGKMQRICIA